MTDQYELWRKRFAHLGFSGMKTLNSCGVFGMNVTSDDNNLCESCVYGKQCRGFHGAIFSAVTSNRVLDKSTFRRMRNYWKWSSE